MLQELEFDSSDVGPGSNLLEPLGHGFQLLLGNLGRQVGVANSIAELFLDRVEVPEEGLVVLDLLVQNGCSLFVEMCGHIVCVDEGLPLVQPFANLTELTGKCGVQKPLPVAELRQKETNQM